MKKIYVYFLLCFAANRLEAQSTYVPLGNEAYWIMDRKEVLSGHLNDGLHSAVKPYLRIELFDTSRVQPVATTDGRTRRDLDYVLQDNLEWAPDPKEGQSKKPVLRHFYQTKANLYAYQDKSFMVHLNPVFAFGLGKQQDYGERLFLNSRGAEVRGWIDQKVGFYLYLADNQFRAPTYVQKQTYFTGVPGEGYYTNFKTSGVDFLSTHGYVTFSAAKFIHIQFGQDKNFIGDGYRSLFLSDNSEDYLFLKLQTQVWKICYENIFADLTSDFLRGPDARLPHKYGAFHHLSLNATRFFNVGLFEGTIFHRQDHFEYYYLNPLIFYHAVEHTLGSPDNALVGADLKANFLRHFSFYGQFLLDDLKFSELKKNDGYWGNKFGLQAGLKYLDAFGIHHLDLQAEWNRVRPYTYSHSDTVANYTQYNQPLAHPLGANFNELLGILRYEPLRNLLLCVKVMDAVKGEDSIFFVKNHYVYSIYDNEGGNINKIANVPTIPRFYNNTVGQGVSTHILSAELTLSYMLRHNFYIDVDGTYRKYTSAQANLNDTEIVIGGGIRWNIAYRGWTF